MISNQKLYILVYRDSKRFLGYSEFASRYRIKAVTFNGDFRESFFETGRQAFESRGKIFDFFIADLTWKLIKVTRKFTTKLNSSKVIYNILKYILSILIHTLSGSHRLLNSLFISTTDSANNSVKMKNIKIIRLSAKNGLNKAVT